MLPMRRGSSSKQMPFQGATCHACKKFGRIQQACRAVIRVDKKQTMPGDGKRLLRKDKSKSQQNSHTANVVEARQQEIDDESFDNSCNHNQNLSTLFQLNRNKAITVDGTIKEKPRKMELGSVSVISKRNLTNSSTR